MNNFSQYSRKFQCISANSFNDVQLQCIYYYKVLLFSFGNLNYLFTEFSSVLSVILRFDINKYQHQKV